MSAKLLGDDLFNSNSVLTFGTEGLADHLLSHELICKGWLPVAYHCNSGAAVVRASVYFAIGTIIAVDAAGNFIECPASRYASEVYNYASEVYNKELQMRHIPFRKSGEAPTLAPDYGTITLLKAGETGLSETALVRPPYSAKTKNLHVSMPAWSFKFTAAATHSDKPEDHAEWNNFRASLGKQIAECMQQMYMPLGKHIEAFICGYGNGAKVFDHASTKEENGDQAYYSKSYLEVTAHTFWIYVSDLAIDPSLKRDERLIGWQRNISAALKTSVPPHIE
ncbi:hypothetical protein C7Y66_09825 [Chroococcidiopsis sp. CCALA 051]|uniref:hypothetical protein n=1 Tax=Chroococcidiopsis sp. CCALA 051 TaxID=869949 RepID=UPI000D0D76DC|nr:hypothetical protein [Chroococcidiopsis sp. CCALA 051]PSM49301.1 hypothetical protein C7Y66_09825 [Chroococcidiopsis sp. CCALA 051]